MSAFQTAQLDEKDSDCGSTGYIEVTLDKTNKGFFEYRYMIEGNKLILLTPDNMKDYLGKTIKLRSPMFCKGDKYCNKCFGELYYMLNIKNVGILANRIGTKLLNLSLKALMSRALI